MPPLIATPGDSVVFFMILAIVLWSAWGIAPGDSSLIQGAAFFVTMPVEAFVQISGLGLIFAAVGLLLFMKYLNLFEAFAGQSFFALAIMAAVVLLLTGTWTI
jgi:hypothetical protein